ncbi:DUF6175 family protein [Flavobacterium sp. W22_SRS_FP1]|uniref:DUF6175 family protein n=1 Tax=Flavobacterium sp. W22_SRS_FP1 TaxID=3240276 RepID=UPI003F8F7B9F
MKNNFNYFLLSLFFLTVHFSFAQAKKPIIMVVPSDNWCIQNNCYIEFDNQGSSTKIPDYKRAVQENMELTLVMNKLGELMAARGFQLKSLEQTLKSLESEAAENAMTSSKSDAGLIESPVDKLKNIAKADIWMQINWKVNSFGPKKSVTFDLVGLDSYTDKNIAGASGTGNDLIGAPLPIMLETAVLSHLDNFNGLLQKHFEDMFENGREVTLKIKKFDSSTDDLESEYEGEELGSIIEQWVSENTVKGRFSTTDASENRMQFEQVRIALIDANGKAQDTRGWSKGLQKFLKEKYQITAKLTIKGLGQASIIIGEK